MAAKTITMSTIKQIIRLHLQGRAIKQISRTCSVSRNTVRKYVALYQQLPYSAQELLSMDDHVVEQLSCLLRINANPIVIPFFTHNWSLLWPSWIRWGLTVSYCGQNTGRNTPAATATPSSVIISSSM